MPTDTTLETLLRASTLTYGHIQLFHDDQGWQASVYHYEPKTLTNGRTLDDPVDALRVALVEDDRKTRDLERRYSAAVVQKKQATVAAVMAADPDDFEDMFG